MRLVLVLSMAITAGVVIVAMVAGYFSFLSFQKKYPTLRDDADMSAFKRLATFQMYLSLPVLYLMWVPPLVWIVGKFVLGRLTWLDGLLFVVLPLVANFAFASFAVKTAEAVRKTPAADDKLSAERDRVADVWVNKTYPEW